MIASRVTAGWHRSTHARFPLVIGRAPKAVELGLELRGVIRLRVDRRVDSRRDPDRRRLRHDAQCHAIHNLITPDSERAPSTGVWDAVQEPRSTSESELDRA